MAWQIGGQAGKAMDATLRSPEQLRISSAVLEFQSLAADTFKWTAPTDDATGTGLPVPEAGQIVQLFKDGVRKFYGWAMRPKVEGTQVSVEVQGPWWWMQRIYLTSDLTDANGGTSSRAQYVFNPGDQDLRTMIVALMDRAIANGVPMLRGSGSGIAEIYPFTRITLSNMTIAGALVKMMARVPDGVAWFDYSTSGELPKLKLARRNGADAMDDLNFTVGADITLTDLSPRLDLEVKRVRLDYMDRHPTTGRARFKSQADGTTVTGKVRIVTTSGPEIVDFLPKDDFESASVRTRATMNDSTVARTRDSALAQINKQFGTPPGGVGIKIVTYTGITGGGSQTSNYETAGVYSFPDVTVQRDNGNYITNLTGKYLVISNDLPEWAIKQYGGIKVTIAGTWIATCSGRWTKAFEALRSGAIASGAGTFNSLNGPYLSWTARAFSYQAVLINTAFPNATTVYKASDYTFIAPPAGMAQGLRTAQDWIPWQGKFNQVSDSVSGTNQLNRAINVFGTMEDCETMRALLKSQSYDLMANTVTYVLGAPARIDFATAAERVPPSPQDVIVHS